jgi:hypothetical protein
MRRVATVVAVTLGALLLLAPVASAQRTLVAFLPTQPAPELPLLFDLAQRDFSYGVMSPSIGGYTRVQMLLDMSAGTRIANRAYDRELGRLELDYDGRGGRMAGWAYDAERARAAPGEVVPGLFAQTLRDGGNRVAYAGVSGYQQAEGIVAADRRGDIERVSIGTAGTFAARTAELLDEFDVVVARFPEDEAGLEALDRLLAQRGPDDLVYALRAPPDSGTNFQPMGVIGPGFRDDVVYSETTRRVGVVAATDMAPTVLRHFGIDEPDEMEGRPVEARDGPDAEQLRERVARLDVVRDRRGPALRAWAAAFVALLALAWIVRRRAGLHWALRVGFLAALWLPGLALLTSALAPSRAVEVAILAAGSLGLGALVDRFVRWPLSPAVPAAIVFGAHAFDMARNSLWIGASVAGSNPKGGARFYGIGNELEILLSMEVLFGLAAVLTLFPRRLAPPVFAVGCLAGAAIMGSGRLGADVGAVITLGAGAVGAVLASLDPRPRLRTIVLAFVLVPVAGILALVGLDLVTGGDAHLIRTVVQGDGPGSFVDVVERRTVISWRGLRDQTVLLICVLALAGFAWALWRRERIYAPLRDHPIFMAGIWGGFAATILGALGNDSGPVIFAGGFLTLLLATGYVRGRPDRRAGQTATA